MKVTCERCGTEYNFDDAKVTEEGVKVKCTRCEHVFRVRKRAFVLTEPVGSTAVENTVTSPSEPDPQRAERAGLRGTAEPPGPAVTQFPEETSGGMSLPGKEPSARKWMIRKFDGATMDFNEMTTLQRWIVERRVVREDEISHNGVKWKRLGSIPELAPFFDIVVAAEPTEENAAAPPPRVEKAAIAVRPDARADVTAAERAARTDPRGGKKTGSTVANAIVLLTLLLAAGAAWLFATEGGAALRAKAQLALGMGRPAPVASVSATPTAIVQVSPSPVATASPAVSASETLVAVAASPSPQTTASAIATVAASPSAAAPSPSPTPTAVALASPAKTKAPPAGGTKSVEKLLTDGYELYSRGKYREAIKKYQAAVDLDQGNSESWALLGLAYLDDGQDELAESCLATSTRLNSHFADSHRYLGQLYAKRGEKQKAITEFNTYLDLRPDGPASDEVRKRVASLGGS